MVFFTGLIGIFGFAAFLGFMLWWVKALPLIIIVIVVSLLLIYDWIMTVRYGDGWESTKR